MAYRLFSALSSLLLAWALAGCDFYADYTGLAERRLDNAEHLNSPTVVGVVWPWSGDLFQEGIELALSEINDHPDKLLGFPLEVRYFEDSLDFSHARSTIRHIARNPELVAVIGHREPEVAIPASLIYQRSQLLFLSPFTTSQRLTAHRFQMIFRMVPGNELLAEQLVSLCDYLDIQRIVVLHSRHEEHREQAVLFLDRALKHGLHIDTQMSFPENTENFRDALARFRNHNFDAIFIASNDDFGGRLVKQIREFGMDQRIIGVDTLDSAHFLSVAGDAAEAVILPTVYYADATTNVNELFVERFLERYGVPPDVYAAQAYDSLHLLAHAMRRIGTRTPVVVASTLRFLPYWIGATGVHAFDRFGNVQGKKYYFKIRRQGRWEILVGAHTAYTIQRFLEYVNARDNDQPEPVSEESATPMPPTELREAP